MKIALLQNVDSMKYRLQHFLNTLQLKNDIVCIKNIDDLNINNFDILLMDYYHPNDIGGVEQMCFRINSFKENLLKFKGKIILYSLDDGQATYINDIDLEILNRIDAWIVYMKHVGYLNIAPDTYKNAIFNKFVKIPRYTIPYINCDDISYESKKNKIVFVGRTTGNYWFKEKNFRIECLDKIWENKFLRDHFDGWIVDDTIIDVPYQNEEYNKTFKYVKKNVFISESAWFDMLKDNTLSLCIPGHTKFGYRHPQSMAFKSTMLANFNLEYDEFNYMFSDKLRGISYELDENLKHLGGTGEWPDLNKFVEICEEALNNREKTKQYAYDAYDVYKKYFELTKENTYQSHVWEIIKEELGNLNIYDI